jgi:hypothetical protein
MARGPIRVGEETTPPPRPAPGKCGAANNEQEVNKGLMSRSLAPRVRCMGHVFGKERTDATRTGCCAVLSYVQPVLFWKAATFATVATGCD